ncbi:dephospho-CoA kinase [Nocardia callitridis]|uniref:Dephospho-CoA kinase n=1 Tax=Nocardia callitridis TaxID=648753 RepID=A0ABP9KLS0_9NOCA
MLRIGLTGGMGAGKSTVARALADLGAVIIDSDVIAREVVEPGTEGLAALVEAFGADILADDGSLNRPALAAKAFGDEQSRATLNSITHPLVGERTAELISDAPADAIVVQDIPLLVENGVAPLFNLVLIVDVEVETRIRRLVEFRGIAESDARARIAAQATDEQRRLVADVLLDNSGPAGGVEAQVRELWDERLVGFEHNVRTETPAEPTNSGLVPADPQWAVQAARVIARLRVVCGGAAVRIDHVGSTAVEGLPAVDVLDIQVTVADAGAADGLRETLTAAGFPSDSSEASHAESGGVRRRHRSADPGRPANVTVAVAGSRDQEFALLLRDLLREDASARAEFLTAKRAGQAEAEGHAAAEAARVYRTAKDAWFTCARSRVTAARKD